MSGREATAREFASVLWAGALADAHEPERRGSEDSRSLQPGAAESDGGKEEADARLER